MLGMSLPAKRQSRALFPSISTKKIVGKKVEIDTDLSLSPTQSYSTNKAWVGQNMEYREYTVFGTKDVFSICHVNN